MNCIHPKKHEARVVPPYGMTELVRGAEQTFVALLAPLVEEQDVVLDLSPVSRIDAAGIAALISLYGTAREAGYEFSVCNVSRRVREILDLVGLDHILESHDADPGSHSEDCLERSAA